MTSAEPTGRVALVTGAGRGIGAAIAGGWRPTGTSWPSATRIAAVRSRRRGPSIPLAGGGGAAISGQAINVSGGHEMH